MWVSAASPGVDPQGNPRGTHGLGRGFIAKMFPGDRGISALLRCFGKPPQGSAHGIC